MSGLAVNALLARLLSPQEMGAYFLSVSIATFLSIIGQAGMPMALVRFIAESMGKGNSGQAFQVIRKGIAIVLLSSGIVAGGYLIFGSAFAELLFHSPTIAGVTPLIAVLLLLMAMQGVLAEIFRGFHDIRLASLLGSVSTSLFSAILFCVLWLAQGEAELSQILLLSLGASSLSVVLSLLLLTPRLKSIKSDGRFSWAYLGRTGWPLCISSLAIMVAVQGDLWVVGAMLGERDAAIYGAALRLLALMTMVHGLAVSVVQSSVAELYGKGELKRLENLVQAASLVTCVVAGGVLVVLAIVGKSLIYLVFGSDYLKAYPVLMILAGGQFLGILFGMAGMVLMMTGHQRIMMWIIISNALVGLLAAITISPYWGIYGVAATWGGTALSQGIIAWFFVMKKISISCRAGVGGLRSLEGVV